MKNKILFMVRVHRGFANNKSNQI